MRQETLADKIIARFDKALRALDNGLRANFNSEKGLNRKAPSVTQMPLLESEQKTSASLMRINHCGEVCAQALYQAQAITAKDPSLSEKFLEAAKEEEEHLAWCAV